MVDLIDYWLSLESSVSGDPDRNFKYAVWRATKEASKFLVGIFQDRVHEVSVDGGVDDEDDERGSLWDRIADTGDGPEDQACESDEVGRARRLIEDAEDGEMDDWLYDLLSGISESESARRSGVNQSTISRRRRAGVRRIAFKACAYGLR